MTIKRLLQLFICIIIPLLVIVVITAIFLNKKENEVEASQQKRFKSYMLAEDLLSSSELLTRFARTYVVTKDIRYKTYFQDVLDIRNGKLPKPANYNRIYWHLLADSLVPPPSTTGNAVSLDQEMEDAGFTLKEFGLLKDAKSLSNQLVSIENEAMGIVDNLEKNTNETDRSANHLKAITMLHGSEYHLAKATIMKPIGQFLLLLDQRTKNELALLNEESELLLDYLLIDSILILISFLFFAFLIYKKLVIHGLDLLKNVNDITAGNLETRVAYNSNDELGVLAKAINTMTDKLAGAINKAEHNTIEANANAEKLEDQKNHSEKLLNNILPVLIADRLKKGESNIAETFPEVTVLFADIVGFTALSKQLPPRQLVNMLNDIFGRFDELSQTFRLEKIKTIGDCYMVVGGVPDRSPTHCQQVADFAIHAIKSIREYNQENGLDIKIRIGMHTGTVVAGIVGKQKYSYDLWGDVVNTASRMESAGMPDKIHVTEAVKIRLSDDYIFDELGIIELKGKGNVNSYVLTEKKSGRE